MKKKEVKKKVTSAEGYCSKRNDKTHCHHWWEGYKCCVCNAPAMTKKEQKEQGMIE